MEGEGGSCRKKATQKGGTHAYSSMPLIGNQETNLSMWSEEVTQQCKEKYCDPDMDDGEVATMVDNHRTQQKYDEQLETLAPRMTVHSLLWARAKLSNNRTNGGNPIIVPEMLKLIPITLIFILLTLFVARYCGEVVEDLPSWARIIVSFIEKVSRPKGMKEFRGVCLLDCFSKLYMSTLVSMAMKMPLLPSFRELRTSRTQVGCHAVT